ncbi:MAG: MGMT family protein [Oscillibacter sp.]|nr:MGMT family protein [Oscillibacter sp.]
MSGRVFAAFCDVVRLIPAGRVATYGQIARLAGMPRCARTVGYAMAACQDPSVPCHRVVDRFGGTKAAFDTYGPGTQRALLEAEGVSFRPNGTVDLARCQWQPEWPDLWPHIESGT